jgi:Fic family protein
MRNTSKPPKWEDLLNGDLLRKSIKSEHLNNLVKKAQNEYLSWDSFKYQPIPEGFTPEEAWVMLKFNRSSLYQNTPVKSVDGNYFEFIMTNSLYQKLNFIDTHASSFIKSTKLSEVEENRFIISGLTEEAIATSQIEGANTTRKVAKEMLESQRKPRTKSEQMIVNSYQVMQKVDIWKNLDLSLEMLLEIQTLVTEKTLDDKNDQGRFRNDTDDIVVKDILTGEIVHIPPKSEEMLSELTELIKFANKSENEGEFMHPVIKATILHFWLAYLHPFPDGNGRTARTIFYWYLLKNNYWLVEYLSVSRAIVNSRKKYDNSFIYSEDENDITYFLLYIIEAFKISIEKFIEHVHNKLNESEEFKKIAHKLQEYNPRQIALLKYFLNHSNEIAEVNIHQAKHGVSRQTAHSDLMNLVSRGLLVQTTRKRKYIFMANTQAIKKLFETV